MDNAPNISDVINVIMQNPEMLGMIKNLVSGNQQKTDDSQEAANLTEESIQNPNNTSEPESAASAAFPLESVSGNNSDSKGERRRQLLSALKPYLSPTRARAIDSMLGFTEIFEVIRKG